MKRIVCLLIVVALSITIGYSQRITSIHDLIQYKKTPLVDVNDKMEKMGWVFKKSVRDSVSYMDCLIWGKPNKNNKYVSEALMIAFDYRVGNIITLANTDFAFYKKSLDDAKKYGYTLKSRDAYKEAYIQNYTKGRFRLVILSRPIVKKGMSFTLYTYTMCDSTQLYKKMGVSL